MRFIGLVVAFFLFFGCAKKDELKISANTWVGYTPLFYADAKGWLADKNIKLIHTVSLNESLLLYNENLISAMAVTQYEAMLAKKKVYPVILLDKSYGADMVMANFPLNKLYKEKNINVYLEIDSINSLLFKYFLKQYPIDKNRLNIKNRDQAKIISSKYTSPSIVVTYSPYDNILEKKGFNTIASTRTSKHLIVLDAVFSDSENIKKHLKQFKYLKKVLKRALKALNDDPREFYKTVKPYLVDNCTYEKFSKELKNIKWLIGKESESDEILKALNLKKDRLIK